MSRDLHQTSARGDREDDAPEPPQLRRFRRIVSAMMISMTIGILIVVVAIVWRLTLETAGPTGPAVTGAIDVPAGYEVLSVSRAGPSLYLLIENVETKARQIEERRAADKLLIGRFDLIPADGN